MAETSQPPIEVPGYRVERFLGAGGFGVVAAAVSPSGEMVALKVATAGDATAAGQLRREEAALRAVGRAAAASLRASGPLPDGPPWLALELIEPPTLAQRLAELRGPMDRAE